MDVSAALICFSKDPWQWAYNLEKAGLAISEAIGACTAAGLAERVSAGEWTFMEESVVLASGDIPAYRLTTAGRKLRKELRGEQ
jgi:hypothetical protein